MVIERKDKIMSGKGGNPMIVLKIIGKIIALPLILILFILWLLANAFMHLSVFILIPCVTLFGAAGIYFLFKTSWFNFGMMTAFAVAGTLFIFLEGFVVVLLDGARSGLKNFLVS